MPRRYSPPGIVSHTAVRRGWDGSAHSLYLGDGKKRAKLELGQHLAVTPQWQRAVLPFSLFQGRVNPWIVLNSWGTSSNRPNGTFRLARTATTAICVQYSDTAAAFCASSCTSASDCADDDQCAKTDDDSGLQVCVPAI